jgi:hypothetical protein
VPDALEADYDNDQYNQHDPSGPEVHTQLLRDGCLTLDTLKNALLLDDQFEPIIIDIMEGHPHDHFELIDGILFRKTNEDSHKICLPDNLLEFVWFQEHTKQGQHRTVQQVTRSIQVDYYSPQLSDTFRQLGTYCYHCVTNTTTTTTHTTQPQPQGESTYVTQHRKDMDIQPRHTHETQQNHREQTETTTNEKTNIRHFQEGQIVQTLSTIEDHPGLLGKTRRPYIVRKDSSQSQTASPKDTVTEKTKKQHSNIPPCNDTHLTPRLNTAWDAPLRAAQQAQEQASAAT